jgi:hypothetical protein
MRLSALAFTIAALGLSACSKSDTAPTGPTAAAPAPTPPAGPASAPAADEVLAAAPAGEAHVHGVACGCSQGQKCSNMIEVDGKYVPLEGELGLGEMEFCGKQGLKAEAQGELKDGKFVATSFKLVDQK